MGAGNLSAHMVHQEHPDSDEHITEPEPESEEGPEYYGAPAEMALYLNPFLY